MSTDRCLINETCENEGFGGKYRLHQITFNYIRFVMLHKYG